jgi:hypothetical protein
MPFLFRGTPQHGNRYAGLIARKPTRRRQDILEAHCRLLRLDGSVKTAPAAIAEIHRNDDIAPERSLFVLRGFLGRGLGARSRSCDTSGDTTATRTYRCLLGQPLLRSDHADGHAVGFHSPTDDSLRT